MSYADHPCSFWDSLTEASRLGSINQNKSRKFGRMVGWHPNGAVLARWNESIYPTIQVIMKEAGNHE